MEVNIKALNKKVINIACLCLLLSVLNAHGAERVNVRFDVINRTTDPSGERSHATRKIRNWRDLGFKNEPFGSIAEAQAFVDQIFDQGLAYRVAQEIIAQLGGLGSSRLWNVYMRSYNLLFPYSDGYREIVEKSNARLPRSGVICDLGAGAGSFSTALLFESPARNIVAVDWSQSSLDIARRKLSILAREAMEQRFQIIRHDLNDIESLRMGNVDAFLISNVLFNIAPGPRLKVLRFVYEHLPMGGLLFLNEPNLQIAPSVEREREFHKLIVRSAFENGSLFTDLDIAIWSGVVRSAIVDKLSYALRPDEWVELVQSAGFKLVDRSESFYGRSLTLTFEK